MKPTTAEDELIRRVREGKVFRPRSRRTVRVGVLRRLLLGDRSFIPAPPPKIMIDGGTDCRVRIIDDDELDGEVVRLLDLSNLSAPQGGSLAALSLRGCRIEGVLDISGSDFAGFQLRNCSLRGLLGDGCKIDNNVTIEAVRPLGGHARLGQLNSRPDAGRNLQPWRRSPDRPPLPQETCCTIRLQAARIAGSVTIRNAVLIGPGDAEFPMRDIASPSSWSWADRLLPQKRRLRRLRCPSEPGHYGNSFAVTLAAAEIGGRLWIRNDVIALCGISIYQAIIRNSVRMEAALLCADPRDLTDEFGRPERRLAFCAEEVHVGGSFLWGSPARERNGLYRGNHVFGRISMVRANIDSDLLFEGCQGMTDPYDLKTVLGSIRSWQVIGTLNAEPPLGATMQPGAVAEAIITVERGTTGGVDLRRAKIGGQLAFYDKCRIGRRMTPVSGRWRVDHFGSAVDAWKAEIGMGILIGENAEFLGPLHLNSCVIGREVSIAGTIRFCYKSLTAAEQPNTERWFGPYHTALSLNDSRVTGFVFVDLTASGRVVLDRLQVDGSVELRKLLFDPVVTAQHRDPERPFEEMSILDMQDLRISGSINLKRGSIKIGTEGDPPLPSERDGYIVDMRGMSCASWDDADATAWVGLIHPRPFWPWTSKRKATRNWRLRFEGAAIQRIDSSRQREPLAREDTTWHAWLQDLRWWATAGGSLPRAGTVGAWLLTRFVSRERLAKHRRTYHAISSGDGVAYRLQALESYHLNKPRRTSLPRWARWWVMLAWRWTLQPSWHRRERVPSFSPQPFDEFARAYSARGDIDVAVALTVRRMTLQWRRSLRLFTQSWSVAILPISMAMLWWAHGHDSLLVERFALAGLTSPALLGTLLLLFRYGYGFGLRARNALITTTLFLLGVGLGLPNLVAFRLKADAATQISDTITPSAHYAFDKLLPLDFEHGKHIRERIERRLGDPKRRCESEVTLPKTAASLRPLREGPTCDSLRRGLRRFRNVDDTLDAIGWVLLSLLLLTLSGIVRRDIERR